MSDRLNKVPEENHSDSKKLIAAICVVAVSVVLSTIFVLIGKNVESLRVTQEIVQPTPEAAVPLDRRSIIFVDEFGGVSMEGKSVSLEELSGRLVDLKLNRVLVRADKSCSYAKLRLVLGEIGNAGIKDIGFSVEGKGVPKSSPHLP